FQTLCRKREEKEKNVLSYCSKLYTERGVLSISLS
ncbi:MAG: hypothetical protein ACI8RD_013299, partial [Bacillariaceae sp.]